MWFHSPPFLLLMEAWNQETKDNMNGMHSVCFHPQLQPRRCLLCLFPTLSCLQHAGRIRTWQGSVCLPCRGLSGHRLRQGRG